MRLLKTFLLAAAASMILFQIALACPPNPEYRNEKTKKLVTFVSDAAELVRQQGEACFPELRMKGKWNRNNLYIFVEKATGLEVVNGAFPEMEGKNFLGWQDARGVYAARRYLDRLFHKGGCEATWEHYLWPKPGQTQPSWKSSYVVKVKAPSGKWYAVGAGEYDLPMERYFVVAQVLRAAALLQAQGEKAFDLIRSRKGGFVFRDTYVFVDDEKGVEVVNPAFPGLEGRNLMSFTNAEGRPVVQLYLEKARQKGSSWVAYYWPKPGSKKPTIKHTFVKGVKVNGKFYVVGAGLYLH